MRNQAGFTLIELMITVAILGVTLGVAVPAYKGYAASSVRADECIRPLAQVAISAEKYIGQNGTYPSTLGLMGLSTSSTKGNYTFSIAAGTTGDIKTSYTASCTPTSTEATCNVMSIDNFGARTATGTAGSGCW